MFASRIASRARKSNVFTVRIRKIGTGSVPIYDTNLWQYAVDNGWNRKSKLIFVVDPGVILSSTTPTVAALTIAYPQSIISQGPQMSAFPYGVVLINHGTIVGKGGAGAYASGLGGNTATLPTNGGPAIYTSYAVPITNNGIIGGGGGGGGGTFAWATYTSTQNGVVIRTKFINSWWGGGGGAGYGSGGKVPTDGAMEGFGEPGGLTTGGVLRDVDSLAILSGGVGGDLGKAGTAGNYANGTAQAGGLAGNATTSSSPGLISWVVQGTIYGDIK